MNKKRNIASRKIQCDITILFQYKSPFWYVYSDRENPDIQKNEYEEYFETENQRELRQIFSGQSQMFDALRELHKKLDEVVGRQERTLSLISQIGQGGKSLDYYYWIIIYIKATYINQIYLNCIIRCTSCGSTRTTTCINRHNTSARSRRCVE